MVVRNSVAYSKVRSRTTVDPVAGEWLRRGWNDFLQGRGIAEQGSREEWQQKLYESGRLMAASTSGALRQRKPGEKLVPWTNMRVWPDQFAWARRTGLSERQDYYPGSTEAQARRKAA